MERTENPLEYIITYIDREFILLETPEQEDILYKQIKNINKINIDSSLEDEITEKVKLKHPSCEFVRNEGQYIQFNYSDRTEPCFVHENNNIFHDQIGFFVYIYNNDIYAGCHSGKCV